MYHKWIKRQVGGTAYKGPGPNQECGVDYSIKQDDRTAYKEWANGKGIVEPLSVIATDVHKLQIHTDKAQVNPHKAEF